MRSAMTTIACVGLVVMLATTVSAGIVSEDLRGIIKMKGGGDPRAVVRVQLKRLGTTVQEAYPREGRFEFLDLAPGRYTLVVEASGYESVIRDVDIPGEWFTIVELQAVRTAPRRFQPAK